MMAIEGGCLCGAVRYRAEGDPINTRVCHCRLCQRAVGAAFNARILFEAYQVEIEGRYVEAHSSDDLTRGFCLSCGTSLFTRRISANRIGITAGSMDDPSMFKPESHIWVSSKQPWLIINDGLRQFEEAQP